MKTNKIKNIVIIMVLICVLALGTTIILASSSGSGNMFDKIGKNPPTSSKNDNDNPSTGNKSDYAETIMEGETDVIQPAESATPIN